MAKLAGDPDGELACLVAQAALEAVPQVQVLAFSKDGIFRFIMGYYRKRIKPGSSQEKFYKAMGFPCLSDTDSLIIRITLGDMDIIDGFYISLPSEAEGLSIEDAIKKYVLSENIKSEVMRKVSQISNLDLLDIYNALLFIYGDAKIGKIRISYHINNGPSYINPAEPVNKYCQTFRLDNDIEYKLLD
ncbi:hypothetical protein FJZ33_11860, partial [Candidatus Poribacteria bacterium]|nr:hypothetical protein [Candidatus Poribacteria bacterium]